ncbi:MAG: hypothetical protein ACRCX1_07940 [Bacteroidales bacterium]
MRAILGRIAIEQLKIGTLGRDMHDLSQSVKRLTYLSKRYSISSKRYGVSLKRYAVSFCYYRHIKGYHQLFGLYEICNPDLDTY